MPPELIIRSARESDAAAMASLVGELGYPTDAATALERWRSLIDAGDIVLLAEIDSRVVGLIVLHRTKFLHRPPDGRISTLVVTATVRSRGVGSKLIEAADPVFRGWGCGRIEVTSGATRDRAHRFYRREGFEEVQKRFIKKV